MFPVQDSVHRDCSSYDRVNGGQYDGVHRKVLEWRGGGQH